MPERWPRPKFDKNLEQEVLNFHYEWSSELNPAQPHSFSIVDKENKMVTSYQTDTFQINSSGVLNFVKDEKSIPRILPPQSKSYKNVVVKSKRENLELMDPDNKFFSNDSGNKEKEVIKADKTDENCNCLNCTDCTRS